MKGRNLSHLFPFFFETVVDALSCRHCMFFQKLKHGPAAGAGPPQHGTLVGWQILAHRCNDQPSEQCLLISDGDRGFGLSFPVRASNLQAAETPISIHLPEEI